MEENKNIEKHIVSEEELKSIAGGIDGWHGLYDDGPWKTVCFLQTGWLALRTYPAYDYSNEIGQLYNGDFVQLCGNGSDNGYVWVYSPKLNKSGWVNSNFLA